MADSLPKFSYWIRGLLIALAPATFTMADEGRTTEAVDFAADVRPILSQHCFACHGPDEEDRQAGLRLDTAEGLADVVQPGEPEDSYLVERIRESDTDMVMPPPKFHKPLSDDQKAILESWIASGASFQGHWSFEPIDDVQPPTDATASTNIDAFLNRKIDQAGLTASGPADKPAVLRRVALDLTGLPPTPAIRDAFLSDESPDAYERLVDRLLESPAYGEHMARYWLDLVRYADTHGLHLDNYREMWPYRDWVIDAFTSNKPFDQFIAEQLAGDLMPGATRAQKIASGFNRLNVTTSEGGSIYDEVFTRNVIDRTDAFGTVFMGLTVGCAVCHDHKFDPIPSKDYYALSAYFNSLDGSALDKNVEDPAPVITVSTAEQDERLAQLTASIEDLRQRMRSPLPEVDRAQRRWETNVFAQKSIRRAPLSIIDVQSKSDATMKVVGEGTIVLEGDAAKTDVTTIIAEVPRDTDSEGGDAAGGIWRTLRLDAVPDSETNRVGASPNGNALLTEITIEAASRDTDDWLPLRIRYALADHEQAGDNYAIRFAHDGKEDNDAAGWAVGGHQREGGRTAWFAIPPVGDEDTSRLRIRLKYLSKFAKHQFRQVSLSVQDDFPSIPEEKLVTPGDLHSIGPFPVEHPGPGYYRSFASRGKAFDVDEEYAYRERPYRWQLRSDIRQVDANRLPVVKERTSALLLHQSIDSPTPQTINLLIGTDDGHVVFLNGKKVAEDRTAGSLTPLSKSYELPLNEGSNRLYIKIVNHDGDSRLTFAYQAPTVRLPENLRSLLSIPMSERSADQAASIRQYYRLVHCDHPSWNALQLQHRGLLEARRTFRESLPTTLVWKETDEPRQANVLIRGQYDQKGEPVDRSTPGFLPPQADEIPNNRLTLAKWLTSPRHPLTSRVAVNRFWQQVFGTGLVETSEDFGSQGDPPSHPELLDWLAHDFIQSGWDVKSLMKQLVMTDAYRRSAKVTDPQQSIDPNNRLLARGPRHRLDAEVLRDQALALADLLVDRRGGPSVKPPQPKGLWYAVGYTRSNTANFVADDGDDVYRRSIYVFWKRTSPPPQMSTFDAPSRESCTARRERTNTPLQALLMMNETQYLDAAKSLGKMAMRRQSGTDLRSQMRWMFRHITVRQPTDNELDELLMLLDDLKTHYQAEPGDAVALTGDSEPSLAAWTLVASTILNLDEVINK